MKIGDLVRRSPLGGDCMAVVKEIKHNGFVDIIQTVSVATGNVRWDIKIHLQEVPHEDR